MTWKLEEIPLTTKQIDALFYTSGMPVRSIIQENIRGEIKAVAFWIMLRVEDKRLRNLLFAATSAWAEGDDSGRLILADILNERGLLKEVKQ